MNFLGGLLLIVVACLQCGARCSLKYPKSVDETSVIYTVDDSIVSNPNDLVTLQSVTGTLAKLNAPVLYRDGDSQYKTWLSDIESKRPDIIINSTFSNDISGLIDHLLFNSYGYLNKLAVYKSISDVSLSAAITYCAGTTSEGVIAVALEDVPFYTSKYNLSIAFDAAEEDLPINSLVLSDNFITFQEPSAQLYLIEWSIYTNSPFIAWDDENRDHFLSELSSKSQGCAAAFGWVGDEGSYVSYITEYGVWAHASDWAKNMVVLSNVDVSIDFPGVDMSYLDTKDVHSVTFIMTDGDNLQWLLGGFLGDSWYGSDDMVETPMGFTLAPCLVDISSISLSYIYDHASSKNLTSFIASPSGVGYIYPELLSEKILHNYAAETVQYMDRTGMTGLNILAGSDDIRDSTLLKSSSPFLAHDTVDGVFYYTYGMGYAGGRGKAVFSSNNKPIITARFSLWGEGTDPEESPMLSNDAMIAALRDQIKDSTVVDGYSVVCVHAWTHTTSDVKYIVDQLELQDTGIEVLTPAAFLKRFDENVKR